MDNSKLIEAFNNLIIINNDRIEGYKTAEAEADETDLKMMFSNAMQNSVDFKKELIAEVELMDGKVKDGTLTSGKLFRMWMDIKAELTANSRITILDSCVFGENTIIESYEDALRDHKDDFTLVQNQILARQLTVLKSDCDKVKHLLNAMLKQEKQAELE